MDYSKVSDVQKIPEMTQACAKSSATRAIPSSEAAQRGITEFSKEASDAVLHQRLLLIYKNIIQIKLTDLLQRERLILRWIF